MAKKTNTFWSREEDKTDKTYYRGHQFPVRTGRPVCREDDDDNFIAYPLLACETFDEECTIITFFSVAFLYCRRYTNYRYNILRAQSVRDEFSNAVTLFSPYEIRPYFFFFFRSPRRPIRNSRRRFSIQYDVTYCTWNRLPEPHRVYRSRRPDVTIIRVHNKVSAVTWTPPRSTSRSDL